MTITDEAIYDMIANGVTTTLTGDIEIDTGLPERLRAVLTAALEGREEPDIARIRAEARGEERERIAAWIETQRRDVPAHGWEFAAAIRGGADDPR